MFVGSWIGSAVVHAGLLMILGWWAVAVQPTATGPRLTASTVDALVAPDLLESSLNLEAAPDPLESAAALQSGALAPQLSSIALDAPSSDPAAQLELGLGGLADMTASEIEGLGDLASSEAERVSGKMAAKFFGSVAYGNRFVFVLDISGSMGDDHRYRAAASELIYSVSQLRSDQHFAVLLFSNRTRTMLDVHPSRLDLVPATDRHKQRLQYWLSSIRPNGWTDPRAALVAAIKLEPDAIFLLSDGQFRLSNQPELGPATLALVQAENQKRIPIHTVAFVDMRSRATLQLMAAGSGGSFRFVANPNIIGAAGGMQ
jgi:hypothetical protein